MQNKITTEKLNKWHQELEVIYAWDKEAQKQLFCTLSGNYRVLHKGVLVLETMQANEAANTLKIGKSKNPQKRIKQLQCATGDKLALLNVLDSMGNKEIDIHKKFDHLRLNAEWFKYSNEIVEFFNVFH